MRAWKKVYTGVGGYSLRQHRLTGKWWIFDPKDKLLKICRGKNEAGIYWAWHTHSQAKKWGLKGLDTFTLIPRRGHHKKKFRSRKVWKVLCPEVIKLLISRPYKATGTRRRNPETGRYSSSNPVPLHVLDAALGARRGKRGNAKPL